MIRTALGPGRLGFQEKWQYCLLGGKKRVVKKECAEPAGKAYCWHEQELAQIFLTNQSVLPKVPQQQSTGENRNQRPKENSNETT